jgi:hypothetical protein
VLRLAYRVGFSLLDADHPAVELTEQLGVPVARADPIAATDAAVVVLPRAKRVLIDRMLARGAVVVTCDASALRGASDRRVVETDCRPLLGRNDRLSYEIGTVWRGRIIVVLEDALRLIADARREWFAFGEPPAFVPCSPVRKGELQRFWRIVLRAGFAHAGFPLIHQWFHPRAARAHAAARVDADWFDAAQWDATIKALEPFGAACSWFLTTRGLGDDARRRIDILRDRGCEIGSHGYVHHTFRDEANNLAAMRLADDDLRRLDVEPASFVSPSAKWSPGLQRAVKTLEYAYSSEFGFAHDALPLRPLLPGYRSALQVPVHPVSPANFLKHGVDSPAIIGAYVRAVGSTLRDACLPVHLYGHPSDIPAVPADAWREVAGWEGLHLSSLFDYARWWIRREHAFFQVLIDDDGRLRLERGAGMPDDVWLAVSWDEDAYHLLPHDAVIGPSAQSLPGATVIRSMYGDLLPVRHVPRTVGLRSRIGEWFDYEGLLPSEHHVVHDVRTAVNHVVKRLRGL